MIETYNQAIEFLNRSKRLNFEDSFNLSKYCSRNLRDFKTDGQARDIIVRVLDRLEDVHPNTRILWYELVEASGLYPYLNSVIHEFGEFNNDSTLLRYEYHKSPNLEGVYLHQEQLELLQEIMSGKSIVLSAPTSFGKSLLIEEIIASNKFNNLVIIQPTLALLDETRKKVSKYRKLYKIIYSTVQQPTEKKGNIFLFTGERVVEYGFFESVDFFVVDEFYKLSIERGDDRAVTLNHAFYKLLDYTDKFYLLGPNIKSIPEEFIKRFRPIWYNTDFKTVAIDEFELYSPDFRDKVVKKDKLFNLLDSLSDPTLIYCSSPSKATELAKEYASRREKIDSENLDLLRSTSEWLIENIHEKWFLIEALEKGVAIHHGAIPRHLGSTIVDLFNQKNVMYLFCTATLIEGVNTSAKNIVLFDKRKGRKSIDFFDYKNIAGRSGRMNQYFIGNIYKFENEPLESQLELDIPFVTQNDAPLELLFQLDENDLKKESKNKLKELESIANDLLPIIKDNHGIIIKGQKDFVAELEKRKNELDGVLNWTGVPNYKQLEPTLDLIWRHLIQKGESKGGIRSSAQLAVITIQYGIYKSISAVINHMSNDNYWLKQIPDDQVRIDHLTLFVLNIVRHWFDYKLPKLLSTASTLQEYVFMKAEMNAGDYTYLAKELENSFFPDDLVLLKEYNIPKSAIQKINENKKGEFNIEEFKRKLREDDIYDYKFSQYEIHHLKQNII